MFSVASVCLSVCLSVCATTFDSLGLESSLLVCMYIFRISRSNLYIKVIGSRSRSQEMKSVYVYLSTERQSCWLTLSVFHALMWTALRYGTRYQTVWEIRPSAETHSSVHWRRFYFQLTRAHSALELFGRCALQIYLLTYIGCWQLWRKDYRVGTVSLMAHDVRAFKHCIDTVIMLLTLCIREIG